MPERKSAKKTTKKKATRKKATRKATQSSSTKSAASSRRSGAFTPEERAAMKEYVQERRAEARKDKGDKDGERDLLAKVNSMKGSDRAMAKKLHGIVKDVAPDLSPRTWYGMPAYAKDGKVLCFFQDAAKFKTRYATLGFTDEAALEKDAMWPVAFALKGLSAAEEKKIRTMLKKAVS